MEVVGKLPIAGNVEVSGGYRDATAGGGESADDISGTSAVERDSRRWWAEVWLTGLGEEVELLVGALEVLAPAPKCLLVCLPSGIIVLRSA